MKKLLFTAFLALMIGISSLTFAADSTPIRNDDFAGLLLNAMDVEIPAGTQNLDRKEAFEVMVNILAEKGINPFDTIDPAGHISYAKLAEALYAIVGSELDLDATGKIQFLVEEGFMGDVEPSALVSFEMAIEILNNPRIAALVPEPYTEPERTVRSGPGAPAPNITPENPASKI